MNQIPSNSCPEMIAAFESQFGKKWNGPTWKQACEVWALAWAAAKGAPIKPVPNVNSVIKNPFQTPARRAQFDGIISEYFRKAPVLFLVDGRPQKMNNVGDAFWRGMDGQPYIGHVEAPLYVPYKAGVAIKGAQGNIT